MAKVTTISSNLAQSPFGMVMPGRNWTAATASGYGFGFNGKVEVDEIYEDAGSLDFGARLYNPKIGRWWKLDDLAGMYSELSPFIYAANNPIVYLDYDGKKITAANDESMIRMMEHFSTMFGSNELTNLLFQVAADGLSLEPISEESLIAAMKSIKSGEGDYFAELDVMALAYGYYQVVNSETNFIVEFVENDQVLDDATIKSFTQDLLPDEPIPVKYGKDLPNGGTVVNGAQEFRIVLNTSAIESVSVYPLVGQDKIQRNADAGIANAIVGEYLANEHYNRAIASESGLKKVDLKNMKMYRLKVENLANRIVSHPQTDGSMYGYDQLDHSPQLKGNCCDVQGIPDDIQFEIHEVNFRY